MLLLSHEINRCPLLTAQNFRNITVIQKHRPLKLRAHDVLSYFTAKDTQLLIIPTVHYIDVGAITQAAQDKAGWRALAVACLTGERWRLQGDVFNLPRDGFLEFNHPVFWGFQHTCQTLWTPDSTPHIVNNRHSFHQVQSINWLGLRMTAINLCDTHKLLFPFFSSLLHKTLL